MTYLPHAASFHSHEGIAPSNRGIKHLSEKLQGHDVVLVIGAPVFRYYPYVHGSFLPSGTRLLHITDDPEEAARAPVGDATLGDAGLALAALLRGLTQSERAAPQRYRPPLPPMPSQTMTAEDLFVAITRIKPDDAVIIEEGPYNLKMLHKHLPTRRPASFFTMASGRLGFGLPAAVGIALGEAATGRRRPVIAIVGDGSLNYSVQALATAANEPIPLIIVVPCNG